MNDVNEGRKILNEAIDRDAWAGSDPIRLSGTAMIWVSVGKHAVAIAQPGSWIQIEKKHIRDIVKIMEVNDGLGFKKL